MDLELLLRVMRCQRNICSLENELTDAKIQENITVSNLYKFRAKEVMRRLEGAEFNLGCVRNSMRKNMVGIHHYKHRRTSSPTSDPGKYSTHPTESISHSIHQHICHQRFDLI